MSTEKSSGDLDLLDELAKQTEQKSPSSGGNRSWNFEDAEEEQTATTQPTPNTPAALPDKTKPDANAIRMSAQATAAAVNLLTTMAGEFAVNLKYYRKFTAEQRDHLNDDVLDADPKTLNADDQNLLNKWERLMAQRDRKMQKITPSEGAKERLEYAFTEYGRITGDTMMSPRAMIGVAVGEHILKTLSAVFMD